MVLAAVHVGTVDRAQQFVVDLRRGRFLRGVRRLEVEFEILQVVEVAALGDGRDGEGGLLLVVEHADQVGGRLTVGGGVGVQVPLDVRGHRRDLAEAPGVVLVGVHPARLGGLGAAGQTHQVGERNDRLGVGKAQDRTVVLAAVSLRLGLGEQIVEKDLRHLVRDGAAAEGGALPIEALGVGHVGEPLRVAGSQEGTEVDARCFLAQVRRDAVELVQRAGEGNLCTGGQRSDEVAVEQTLDHPPDRLSGFGLTADLREDSGQVRIAVQVIPVVGVLGPPVEVQ